MDDIIVVKSLKKNYGSVKAVKGISFSAERGSLLAFLGPNGAGKSTTIGILCTLLKCEEGDIEIDGLKLGKADDNIRKEIGIAFQNNLLDDVLTIRENLISRGSIYGTPKKILRNRVEEIAKITGIEEILDRRYGKLSGGQRRRADLARALINEPKILFLDEPTTGLDPKTRQSIWDTIIKMKEERNMTIFLTTHYMEEAANANKVIIINNGEIIEVGTPIQLKDKYTKDHIIFHGYNETLKKEMEDCTFEYGVYEDRISIVSHNKQEAFEIISKYMDNADSFEVIKGNMDDVFLSIIGGENK